MKHLRVVESQLFSLSMRAAFQDRHRLGLGLFLGALSVIPIQNAVAAGNALFEPAPTTMQQDPSSAHTKRLDRIKKEKTTAKVKLVVVNLSALNSDRVEITLDSGKVLTYERTRIDTSNHGTFTWYGHLPDKQGSAILVVNNGMVTGSVRDNNDLYKIESTGSGLHAFIKTDSAGLPPEHPPHSHPSATDHQSMPRRSTATAPGTASASAPKVKSDVGASISTTVYDSNDNTASAAGSTAARKAGR